MLVLSRRKGESIQIGNDITITVMRVAGCTVRIGIDAPASMKITRSIKTPEDSCNARHVGR